MNDWGLTNMAAVAAGLFEEHKGMDVDESPDGGLMFCGGGKTVCFDPLTDDGDALRLAVKLGLVVCMMKDAGLTGVYIPAEHIGGKYDAGETYYLTDPCAATRRAIVRAAAEIGRTMTTELVR